MKKLIGMLFISILILAGCSESNTVKVGFSVSTLNNPFFVTMVDSIKEEADKLGYDIVIVDAGDDAVKQATDIEDLVAQGIDYIGINPVDSDAIGNSVEYLNENNIPVFTVDRTANSGTVVTHIASDNNLGGQMAAELAAETVPNGNVFILEGVPGASATIDRGEGFEQAATDNGLTILGKNTANFNRSEGLTITEDAIQKYGDEIDIIFAHNDEMALGAIGAYGDNLGDVIIIGFDATDDAKKAVEDGTMLATVEQQPSKMGSDFIKAVSEVEAGNDIELFTPVEVKLVIKE